MQQYREINKTKFKFLDIFKIIINLSRQDINKLRHRNIIY